MCVYVCVYLQNAYISELLTRVIYEPSINDKPLDV